MSGHGHIGVDSALGLFPLWCSSCITSLYQVPEGFANNMRIFILCLGSKKLNLHMQVAMSECKQLETLWVQFPECTDEIKDFSRSVQRLIKALPNLKVLRWKDMDNSALHSELDAECMACPEAGLQLLDADICEWRDYSPLPRSLRYLILNNRLAALPALSLCECQEMGIFSSYAAQTCRIRTNWRGTMPTCPSIKSASGLIQFCMRQEEIVPGFGPNLPCADKNWCLKVCNRASIPTCSSWRVRQGLGCVAALGLHAAAQLVYRRNFICFSQETHV
jgi:hypothetical protein